MVVVVAAVVVVAVVVVAFSSAFVVVVAAVVVVVVVPVLIALSTFVSSEAHCLRKLGSARRTDLEAVAPYTGLELKWQRSVA